MKHLHFILCALVLTTSCYKEVIITQPDSDRFDLKMTEDKRQFVNDSRDTSYIIEDSELQLFFNDELLDLKEIRVRGKSALRYHRKSYTVFLHEPILVDSRDGSGVKRLSRFKLLAMAMDYTYIENRISFGLLETAGVMPLFYKYVELRMNDQTQGVYLLMEDPEQYYKENGSEFIIRRGYNHAIEDSDYSPQYHYIPVEIYERRFKEIYLLLTQLNGEELYKALDERLNLNQYFVKIGMDYLLKNGDYTDEIYLVARIENDTIRYTLIPWDYDDIFSANPHEVGRAWGMGTLYGKRYYETMEDIYAQVGKTLIYSIEDDLDYTIANDPVLYQHYLEALKKLFEHVDVGEIERVFSETKHELSTFYNSMTIIGQSAYDQDMCTKELWQSNMIEKQEFLEDRLMNIHQQLLEIE